MEPTSETNDLERQLKRQAVRRLPKHWRGQILAAAGQKRAADNRSQNATSFWRELLWPCPQVWAGLAAAWIVVLFLSFGSDESREASQSMAKQAQPSEAIHALAERQRLLAELLDSTPTAEAPAPFVPRRRSGISPQTFAV